MRVIELEAVGKRYRRGADFARYIALRDILGQRLRGRSPRARAGRDFWALRDVSFALDEGDVLGVIGRNGAGKSTLLKILGRITAPTEGVSRTRGRVGSLLEVGTGFHPELSGRENVFLNGSILGMPRRETARRFDEIVAFAGVEAFLDTPLKRYSTGMELRLAFAVAAHLQPPILIVDEVLAVGDAEFQQRCLGTMSELGRSGRTVVFVSHDLGAVQQLCPRTVWLDDGRVRAHGRTSEVIERYLESGLAGDTHVEFEDDPEAVVALESVSVTDPSGAPLGLVRRDEPFSVRVAFATRRALPDLDLTVYLLDRHGLRIIDEAWSDTGMEPSTRAGPGRHEATITLAPMLAPDHYHLGVWMGSAIADGEDYLHRDVLTLRVAPAPGDRQDGVDRSRLLQPVVTWEMRRGGGSPRAA